MALYFKINTDATAINQSDKSKNKKAAYLVNFMTRLENDANVLNEKLTDFSLYSFPINCQHFAIRNIQIYKDIFFSGLAGANRVTFYLSDLGIPSLPIPKVFESLFVGLSDQDTNPAVVDIQSYCAQANYMSIPFAFQNFIPPRNNFPVNEKFSFGKNKVYLNAFITHEMYNPTLDVTDFYTMLTAKFNYVAVTLDTIFIKYSVFIYGIMDNDKFQK